MPALIVPVLAAAAVLQVMLPYAEELSVGGVPSRQKRVAPPPQAPLVSVPTFLGKRDLFSPAGNSSAEAAAAPTDALGGAVIAGTVQRGRGLVAVVQEKTGRIRYVGPGGKVAGWRISGLTASGARLTRGTESINAAYGAIAAAPAAPAPENPEDGQ
ncbi:hypothetical protein [Novosphingobium sp. Chol11]|uniref:hypothetical protein n=1 Tax=Novosphingobium sp. Chol11 TaxID=1385763 RepID=UPI0025DCEAC6|nr:hypothetical protein [Novosphingobium sp. Chol11]